MDRTDHEPHALARRSTAQWIAGGQRTLRAGAEGSIVRVLARNVGIIAGLLCMAGLLAPSDAVRSVPGQAIAVDEVVRWTDAVEPRSTTGSRIHLLTVRSVELPLLAAWLLRVDPDPVAQYAAQVENPDRRGAESVTTYAAIAGQNAAGIPDDERFSGFSVGFRLPGSPIDVAGIPFGARVTGLDGQPFLTLDQAEQSVGQRAARGGSFELDGEVDGANASWALPAQAGPLTGWVVLRGLDPEYEVEPRTFQLRPDLTWHGDSSTLAIALAVYERYAMGSPLSEDVAATGFTAADGSVEGIDGVAEKVVAADRRGIRVVIVPSSNRRDAARAAQGRGMRIIGVDTVAEAVAALDSLS